MKQIFLARNLLVSLGISFSCFGMESSLPQKPSSDALQSLISCCIKLPFDIQQEIFGALFPQISANLSDKKGSYQQLKDIKQEIIESARLLYYLQKKCGTYEQKENKFGRPLTAAMQQQKKNWYAINQLIGEKNNEKIENQIHELIYNLGIQSIDNQEKLSIAIMQTKLAEEFLDPNFCTDQSSPSFLANVLHQVLIFAPVHKDGWPIAEQVVAQLLSYGANPNKQDQTSEKTPLIIAMQSGSISLMRLLLDHQANPNLFTQSYYSFCGTALHHAVFFENKEAVRLLLAYQANPRLLDNENRSSLDYARDILFWVKDAQPDSQRIKKLEEIITLLESSIPEKNK